MAVALLGWFFFLRCFFFRVNVRDLHIWIGRRPNLECLPFLYHVLGNNVVIEIDLIWKQCSLTSVLFIIKNGTFIDVLLGRKIIENNSPYYVSIPGNWAALCSFMCGVSDFFEKIVQIAEFSQVIPTRISSSILLGISKGIHPGILSRTFTGFLLQREAQIDHVLIEGRHLYDTINEDPFDRCWSVPTDKQTTKRKSG